MPSEVEVGRKSARDIMRRFRKRHPRAQAEANKRFAERHPERQKEIQRRYNKKRYDRLTRAEKDKANQYEKDRRRRIQQEAIDHYGGKCFCCGETIRAFLTLDHINGGGTKHRREIGVELASWAKRNGWPPILRAACYNCNCGARINGGRCPHQSQKVR